MTKFYATNGGKVHESIFKAFTTVKARNAFLRTDKTFAAISAYEASVLVPLHEAAKQSGR